MCLINRAVHVVELISSHGTVGGREFILWDEFVREAGALDFICEGRLHLALLVAGPVELIHRDPGHNVSSIRTPPRRTALAARGDRCLITSRNPSVLMDAPSVDDGPRGGERANLSQAHHDR